MRSVGRPPAGRLLALTLLVALLPGCRALKVNTTSLHPVARDTWSISSSLGTVLVGGPVALVLSPITLPIALIAADTLEEGFGIVAAPWIVGLPAGWLLGGVVTGPVWVGSLPFADSDEELLVLLEEGSPGDQVYAATVLGELGNQEAALLLEDILLFGAPPEVEIAATDGLLQLVPAEAGPQLLVDRLSALYPESRLHALERLGDRKERQAVVAIIRCLHPSNPEGVREEARCALAGITGREETEPGFEAWRRWWEVEGKAGYPPQLLPQEMRAVPAWQG